MKLMRQGSRMIYGLKDLCRFIPKDATMVEVGCYRGESTRVWLSEKKVKKLICIDVWDLIHYSEKDYYDKDVVQGAEKAFDAVIEGQGVTKIKERSSVALQKLIDDGVKIDIIYIDGDHSYKAVKNDIALAKKLVRPGGIIAGHDLHHPKSAKAIKEAFDFVDVKFCDASWLKFTSRIRIRVRTGT